MLEGDTGGFGNSLGTGGLEVRKGFGNVLHLKSHAPVLDGLRGVSILLVMLNHWTDDLPPFFEFFRARGHLGVEVFFAISGFLVTRSLHACLLQNPSSPLPVIKGFLIRRLARIFVPYMLMLGGVFALSQVVPSLSEKLSNLQNITPSFFLYYYNYAKVFAMSPVPGSLNISWSLCFEEQFYLLLAGFFLIFPKNLPQALSGLCLGVIALRFFQLYHEPDLPFFQLQMETHRRMDAILWGVLLYFGWPAVLSAKTKCSEWVVKLCRLFFFLGGVAVFVSGTISAHSWGNGWVFTGTALFFTGLLAELLLFQKTPWNVLLKSAPMVMIGKISYEIYLVHQLVNGALVKTLRGSSFYGVCYLAGSLVLAYGFYRCVSLPSQVFLRKNLLNKKAWH